jgi:lipopolysaccharide export system protein LptA
MRQTAASAIVLALLIGFASSPASGKSSDRDQPMDVDADQIDALMGDNAVTRMRGNVRIRQGSLEVDADEADIHQVGGETERIVFRGSPARMRQVSDAGEPMDATAREVVYTMSSDVILLTGGVSVVQTRGTLSGERIKYDVGSGRLDGGGDGQRVKMRIMPQSAPAN